MGTRIGAFIDTTAFACGVNGRSVHWVKSQRIDMEERHARSTSLPIVATVGTLKNAASGRGINARSVGRINSKIVGSIRPVETGLCP